MKRYFGGFDNGNGTGCGVVYQNGQLYGSNIIPNFMVAGTKAQQDEQKDLAHTRSNVPFYPAKSPFDTRDYILSYNGISTYHGALAFGSKNASTGLGDISRYWSDRAKRTMYTVFGSIIPDPEFEASIVTHLPLGSFTRQNRDNVMNELSGDFSFKLNGVDRHMVAKIIQIVPEGAGELIAYGENTDVLQGGVNIGFYSTDLYVAQGQEPVRELCGNIPKGVSRIGELINQELSSEYTGLELSPKQFQDILMALSGYGVFPLLHYKGKKLPDGYLQGLAAAATNVAGDEIKEFIGQKWRSNERGDLALSFAKIVFGGGGYYYYRNTALKNLPHLFVPNRPEMAGAEGYAVQAESLGAQAA